MIDTEKFFIIFVKRKHGIKGGKLYGKYDTALVSPKKRNEFINEIKDRCSCIVTAGVEN